MGYFLFEDDNLDLNLVFEKDELADFKELWDAGISAENIARKMRRRPSEIILLIFDHAERNLITRRETGVLGL